MPPHLHHRPASRQPNRGRRGAGIVEYALLLMLVALAATFGLQALGHAGSSAYSHVSSGFGTTTTSTTTTSTSSSTSTTTSRSTTKTRHDHGGD